MSKRHRATLRIRREQLGLSQRALADAVGVTQQAIALYEGGSLPPIPVLVLLAGALGCSPYDLGNEYEISPEAVARLDRVVDAQHREARRRLEVDGIGRVQRSVAEGALAARAGRPQYALRLARRAIADAQDLEHIHGHRRDLRLVLMDAYYLATGSLAELHPADFLSLLRPYTDGLFALGRNGLTDTDAEPAGLLRLADAYMMAGSPDHLVHAAHAAEQGLRNARSPHLKAHGLRIAFAVARRRPPVSSREIRQLLLKVEHELAFVDHGTRAFTQQGVAFNLAAIAPNRRREAFHFLESAEQEYAQAVAAGNIDTHVEQLTARTRAVLHATEGIGFALDQARTCAETVLPAVAMAGRRRTQLHLEHVLSAVDAGIALPAIPR